MAEPDSEPGSSAEAIAGASLPVDDDVVATFCFVDIAGCTALTDSHGERVAADLVEVFGNLVHGTVARDGRVQELTGDNAFLVFPDAVVAMQAIGTLYRGIAGRRDFPLRANRYFGSSVNIAARTATRSCACARSSTNWQLTTAPPPRLSISDC